MKIFEVQYQYKKNTEAPKHMLLEGKDNWDIWLRAKWLLNNYYSDNTYIVKIDRKYGYS